MNFDSAVRPETVQETPLAGVLGRATVDLLGGKNIFRRYGGSFTTSTQTCGMPDVSRKPVGFSIGVRSVGNVLGTMFNASTPRIEQQFTLSEVVRTELSGFLRRFSNFGHDFLTADLAGVVFMLSAASAKYSATGTLTCAEMRCGNPILLTSLTTQDKATTAKGNVFIPRHTALVEAEGLFEALCAAVNGMGGRVVSDVVGVDPLNNAPRLIEPEGAVLAHACWVGLRFLIHLYDMSGSGAIAALAAAKGVHSVLSVVAHSDEGGIMRSVLRSHRYDVPYGGIYLVGAETYVGLPTYRKVGDVAQQVAVDTLALVTAAAVSVSDPTVLVEGRAYPTTITAYGAELEASGTANEGTEQDARAITSLLYGACGKFASLYVAELARIFKVSGGEPEAARALVQMFGGLAGKDERHARHRTIAPYYWVEPTCLYGRLPDTAAVRAGFGPLAGTLEERNMPVAERLSSTGSHFTIEEYILQWRTARTVGWAVHMLGHARGGAANLTFSGAHDDHFVLKGTGEAENVYDALENNEDIGQFMWGHASCQIPAPAECMYIGRCVQMRSKIGVALDGFNFAGTHTFLSSDLLGPGGNNILVRASPPSAIPAGGAIPENARVRRARSFAAVALECARAAVARAPAVTTYNMRVRHMEPPLPPVADEGLQAPASSAAIAADEESSVIPAAVQRQGAARAHVMIEAPLRPRMARDAVASGGGAVAISTPLEPSAGIAADPVDGPAPGPLPPVEGGGDIGVNNGV